MIPAAFLSWWYGAGWRALQHNVKVRLRRTMATFSVQTLTRTLFAPWKRIITTPGAGIEAKMRAIGDNMVSRAVGFTIRIMMLFVALLAILAVSIGGVIQIILWPLVPVLIVVCLVKGIVG